MKKEDKKEEIKEIKEDDTKKTIITLLIGILVGCILTVVIFLIARPCNERKIPSIRKNNVAERIPNKKSNSKRFYQSKDNSIKEENKTTEESKG